MNKKQHLNENGFAHIILFVMVILVIGAVGYGAYRVANKHRAAPSSSTASTPAAAVWPVDEKITWEATGQGGWITTPYDIKPPACPNPLVLNVPTSALSEATSIMYPGQTRVGTFEGKGGNYKPHGGFRFDKSTDNKIPVVMPFNGSVFRGSRFLVDGEIQYDFDVVNACGIMVRLGHLRDLTPAFQAIADKFPAAIEGDSRTTKVTPNIPFKTGEVMATAVGFKTTKNVGFDFGVYDLRSDNEASKHAAYKAAHADTAELSSHALCWLDLLSPSDMKTVKALPAADQVSGKTSDYCKP
jgi:hypothetical protein